MGLTVAQELIDAESRHFLKPVRRIYYKKRLLTGAVETFDASWTQIPDNEVNQFGTITRSFDRPNLNEVKTTNVSARVLNTDHRWKEGSGDSIFDGGFIAYKTKFQIRMGFDILKHNYWNWGDVASFWGQKNLQWGGYRNPEGIEEAVLFTGYLVNVKEDHQVGLATLDLEGSERLLRDADAENVSLAVNETFDGDNSTVDFTTVAVGVGGFDTITVDGVAQTIGVDVDISQLDEISLGAKLTFTTVPPTGTANIVVAGFKWKQGRSIDNLIKDLLTEAGITDHSQVSPVQFPNDVLNIILITSESDWLAGVNTRIDATNFPGDIKIINTYPAVFDDFSDGDFTSSPAWTVGAGGTGSPGWSVVSEQLKFLSPVGIAAFDAHISTPSTQVYGIWEFFINVNRVVSGTSDGLVYFISDASTPGAANGYAIRLQSDDAFGFVSAALFRVDAGVLTQLSGRFVIGSNAQTEAFARFRIIRHSDGQFEILAWNGTGGPPNTPNHTSILVDNTHTTSTHIVNRAQLQVNDVGGGNPAIFDDFRLDTVLPVKGSLAQGRYHPSGGIHQMQPQNLSATVKSLGLLERTETVPTNTDTLYETETSLVSSPFVDPEGLQEIEANGQMISTVRQFLRATLTLTPNDLLTESPTISDITINYATTDTNISLANFRGLTVYQAIQELAKLPDYEWGFRASEIFFFRQKEVNPSADYTWRQSDSYLSIKRAGQAYNRVFNQIKFSHGIYTKEENPVTQGEAAPTSWDKYGKRKLTISGGQLLVDGNADIATGGAQAKYTRQSVSRLEFFANLKMFTRVELSDVVNLILDELAGFDSWHWGDTSVSWGLATIYWGGKKELAAGASGANIEVLSKVVVLRHNLDNFTMSAELEAV